LRRLSGFHRLNPLARAPAEPRRQLNGTGVQPKYAERNIFGRENPAFVRLTRVLLVLLFLPALASSETLSGRVVRVVDGDTAYVLDAARTQHKVRLGGIDAWERGGAVDEAIGGANPVRMG
jgi:endonuclease YncB( thermonuclease family)